MQGNDEDGAFYEGQNAYARGEGRTACPAEARAGAAWIAGWREAKRYADVARIITAAREDATSRPAGPLPSGTACRRREPHR